MTDSTPPAAPTPASVQPVYGQPAAYGYVYGPRTNALAITALVLAFVVPVAAIVTGHLALGQIKTTGEAGRGLAIAGTVIGYVYCGIFVLVILAYVAFAVIALGGFALFSTLPHGAFTSSS